MSASCLPWQARPISAVLFDLDGTLLDTVGDIAAALNLALEEAGLPPRPVSVVRDGVGRGAAMLLQRVLAGEVTDGETEARLLDRFFHHYAQRHAEGRSDCTPFSGVRAGLEALGARGLRLGVVTNKRHDLALAALEHAGLLDYFSVVVGGDTCAQRKPDPEPLLYALQALGVSSGDALMVGDSANDVLAARAAGMPIVCVPYGYTEGSDPRELACDAFIESIDALPTLLPDADRRT